jgi:hypothetical protein
MFNGATQFKRKDLSQWNVQSESDMSDMFANASSFN